MRILFLSENFPPEVNATASRVYERAVYWAREGHDVIVLTSFPNFPQGRLYPGYKQRLIQRETMDGMRVVRVPTYIARNDGVIRRTLDFMSFLVTASIAAIWLPRPTVVAATSPQFFCAVAGWITSRFRRRPFVMEVGDLWPASITAVGAIKPGPLIRAIEKLELFLYRAAAAVVVLTPAFKRNLVARGIMPDKIAVVINGVDLPRYSPRPRDADLAERLGLTGEFILGYIGTHGMAHGLDNAVRAAARLKDRLPNFRLLFVGDGAAKASLTALADECDARNVMFVGPQPKSAIQAYWSLCDLALVHLKNDSVFSDVIPSKMFEAMAMGRPIVFCGPAGEASNIVEREGAGVSVSPSGPEALADAIEYLHGVSTDVADMGARSLVAARRYSRRRQAKDLLRVLEAAASGRGSQAAQLSDIG